MKLFTAILSLAVLTAMMGCGDEGVGFNIGKEVPVPLPTFTIPAFTPPNVPASSSIGTFSLSDVASENDLQYLDGVVVNAVNYSISGVDNTEGILINDFSLHFSASTTGDLGSVDITGGNGNYTLTNVDNAPSGLNFQALTTALTNNETISASFSLELGSSSAQNIDFDFEFIFDVFVKIRQ